MSDSLHAGWSLGAGLEGRGVIVTGAAQGIGRAAAEAVARAGVRVLAVDRNAAALATVLDGLEGSGHASAAVDLTDLDTHAELVSRARSELGGLWGIAHFAGVLRRRPDLASITEEDWDVQHEVNLKASFFLCRAVGLALQEDGTAGRIVTVSSQGWQSGGFGGSVVYAASKGGIVSMTRGLARSLGPSGICVNCISPGNIDTPMLMQDLDPAALDSINRNTPLGRLGRPDEVASVAVFLLSTHASFVSGATLNVSGAFLMY
jgi:NAD(P)-dependent dehydrogenase (short-subunit alcohol dehydrogenase family)